MTTWVDFVSDPDYNPDRDADYDLDPFRDLKLRKLLDFIGDPDCVPDLDLNRDLDL